MSFLGKIFGDANERYIKSLQPIVDVKDELQVQIKKFKEKRTDLERQPKE